MRDGDPNGPSAEVYETETRVRYYRRGEEWAAWSISHPPMMLTGKSLPKLKKRVAKAIKAWRNVCIDGDGKPFIVPPKSGET